MAVWDATQAELDRLGATESFEGQLALRLAEQVDSPRAGMAVAQDSKELRSVMAEIRAGQQSEQGDPLDAIRDELGLRRSARGSAAEAG